MYSLNKKKKRSYTCVFSQFHTAYVKTTNVKPLSLTIHKSFWHVLWKIHKSLWSIARCQKIRGKLGDNWRTWDGIMVVLTWTTQYSSFSTRSDSLLSLKNLILSQQEKKACNVERVVKFLTYVWMNIWVIDNDRNPLRCQKIIRDYCIV